MVAASTVSPFSMPPCGMFHDPLRSLRSPHNTCPRSLNTIAAAHRRYRSPFTVTLRLSGYGDVFFFFVFVFVFVVFVSPSSSPSFDPEDANVRVVSPLTERRARVPVATGALARVPIPRARQPPPPPRVHARATTDAPRRSADASTRMRRRRATTHKQRCSTRAGYSHQSTHHRLLYCSL